MDPGDRSGTPDEASPDARVPGASSGISAIVEQAFGEPAVPTLTRRQIHARIEQALAGRGFAPESIAISDVPVRRNALSDAAGKRVAFPDGAAYDRCFVALVDPDRAARWAHPAWWAFVPADGSGPVELRDTRLPEHPRGAVRLVPVP